jgi:hypothetical protein
MPKIDKAKMKCNAPKRQISGGKKSVVKACDKGKEKIVRFGDANMTIKKSDPKRRKSFRARHGCDEGTLDKLKARYWSCKAW